MGKSWVAGSSSAAAQRRGAQRMSRHRRFLALTALFASLADAIGRRLLADLNLMCVRRLHALTASDQKMQAQATSRASVARAATASTLPGLGSDTLNGNSYGASMGIPERPATALSFLSADGTVGAQTLADRGIAIGRLLAMQDKVLHGAIAEQQRHLSQEQQRQLSQKAGQRPSASGSRFMSSVPLPGAAAGRALSVRVQRRPIAPHSAHDLSILCLRAARAVLSMAA
jgi:hypothetical protein